MNPNKGLIPMVRDEIDRLNAAGHGEFNLEDIVSYVETRNVFVFNPEEAKKRCIESLCRSVIASYRDDEGVRHMLASGRDGSFIDADVCTNQKKLRSTFKALEEKRDGYNRVLSKVKRQVDGQLYWQTSNVGRITVQEYSADSL